MTDSNIINLNKPGQNDPLQEVLREGARKMLATAIESEVAAFIEQHSVLQKDEGKAAVVRNGYLPERSIQTGLGDIDIKVPKVRDRSGSGIKFNSSLAPPYLKRSKNIQEFLPWLYLRGISTGDFSETLKHLLGPDAPGLSAATISRLKQDWEQNYQDWTRRDLSKNATSMFGRMAYTAMCGWMIAYVYWSSSGPMKLDVKSSWPYLTDIVNQRRVGKRC